MYNTYIYTHYSGSAISRLKHLDDNVHDAHLSDPILRVESCGAGGSKICRTQRSQTLKIIYWLVVDLPLWKIWKSVGMILPNIIYGKKMFQSTNPFKSSVDSWISWVDHMKNTSFTPLFKLIPQLSQLKWRSRSEANIWFHFSNRPTPWSLMVIRAGKP